MNPLLLVEVTILTAERGGSLALASVAARIAVDDVYRDGLEDS